MFFGGAPSSSVWTVRGPLMSERLNPAQSSKASCAIPHTQGYWTHAGGFVHAGLRCKLCVQEEKISLSDRLGLIARQSILKRRFLHTINAP